VSKALSPWFGLSLCTLGYLYATSNTALAQVTSDGTVNTQVNQNGNVAKITGGETRGGNLFHSFRDFSVGTGETASFLNSNDIANIFSRVTGGNISNINGLIQAKGSANLFLINPAGILFGENARLDVGGSFLGSTADSVLFEDGEFSATDLENPPVLTINAPIGLNLRDNPGDITVRGNGQGARDFSSELIDTKEALRVNSTQTFALVGGKINLEGATIKTAGGRIELGSLEGNEQVSLNPINGSFSLGYEGVQNFRDVQLSQGAIVDASGKGGGNIRLYGKNITFESGSQLEASTLGSLGGGSSEVIGSESININGSYPNDITALIFQVYDNATGNGGDLFIKTKNLSVNNAFISVDTFGQGDAGNLTIDTINSNIISSQISTSSFGEGNVGNLNIFASDFLKLEGEFVDNNGDATLPGGLFAQVDIEGQGNGGNLNIDTKRLSVSDGSKIQVSTFGLGNAGNLTIRASDIEVFETPKENFFSTGIFAETSLAQIESNPDVQGIGKGNAGNLTIDTERLSIRNGGQVSASTFGDGNAGELTVKASDYIEVIGKSSEFDSSSVLRADVIRSENNDVIATGTGGNLTIETKLLNIRDGGLISTSTSGNGDAGNLNINAFDSINISGEDSGIFAETTSEAQGRGGDITIQTGSLSLNNKVQISTTYAATPLGLGGNINLNVDDAITLQNNSLISAQAFNNGSGGNVNIDTNFIIAFPNQIDGNGSDIIASAAKGNGGRISINAESLLGIQERKFEDNNRTNDIDASSEFGLDGTVSIFTPDINPVQGATELPSNIVEAEQTTEQACEANRETEAKNGLVVNGKGGIPAPPDQPLTSQNLLINCSDPK
jgi:filamentous hemagglutinin family protein